jgi:hypothetical protein
MRVIGNVVALIVGVLLSISALAQGLDVEYVHPATEGLDPARQFDFWVGEWDINNKSKRGDDWVEWPSQAIIEGAAGGDAIVEFWNSLEPSADIVGFSMRWYDQEADECRMIGTLEGDAIVLFPPGFKEEGRQQGARFLFSKVTPTSLQWHQEVTADGGETWDTTWIMEWTRRDHVNEPIDRDKHHRVDDVRCDSPEARALDEWVGEWGQGYMDCNAMSCVSRAVSMRRVLGGCGMWFTETRLHRSSVGAMDSSSRQVVAELWTFNSANNQWESVSYREHGGPLFGRGRLVGSTLEFSYADRYDENAATGFVAVENDFVSCEFSYRDGPRFGNTLMRVE